MESLKPYAECFEAAYPGYADARYEEIRQLVEIYSDPQIIAFLESEPFAASIRLIRPVVAIKNYKSQVPFPEDIRAAVTCIREIACTTVRADDALAGHATLLNRLLGLQGFRLPTASAVLHFCHPEHFPIVDVNVEAACVCLSQRYPQDFQGIDVPCLPRWHERGDAVVCAYRDFISFIKRVCDLQVEHTPDVSYRYIDKALMVLGGGRLAPT